VGDRPAGGGRSAPETSAHRPGATAGAAHAAAPTAFQSASPAASLGAAQAPARARQLPAGRSEPETGRCASGRLGRGSLPADRPARTPAAVRTIAASSIGQLHGIADASALDPYARASALSIENSSDATPFNRIGGSLDGKE
jgi:hypothetical protein